MSLRPVSSPIGRDRGVEATHPDPRGDPRPLDKERELFVQGIKVLSLFFIDEVAKYRDYTREDTLGDYARVFEEEYQALVADELSQFDFDAEAAAYRVYLESIPVRDTHQGYFSIDKRTKRQVDGEVKKTGDEKGQSTDTDAYDLILKDKERLLSFDEPVRFIFSHSALREGWDNPNVFVMGMLKKSDNTVSRRQEIGRGLRLAVDQHGERMDNPVTVHDINQLTVVTDESYTDFVTGLPEGDRRLASRPPAQGERQVLRRQDIHHRAGESHRRRASGERALQVPRQERLHRRRRHDLRDLQGGPRHGHPRRCRLRRSQAVAASVWPLVDALYLDIPRPATAASRSASRSTRRTSTRRSSRSSGAESTTRPSTRSSSTPTS